MSLTGAGTTWVLWLVATATFVSSILWPRTRPTTRRRSALLAHLRRAGMQLAVVVTALAAVSGTLNAQYAWYSSWSDLASSLVSDGAPAGGTSIVAGGPGAGAPSVGPSTPTTGASATTDPGADPSATTEPTIAGLTADPGPDGQYLTVTVPGPTSGVTGSVDLWVPRSYTDPAFAHHRYPVVEAFHGVPGGPFEYAHDIGLGRMVAGLARDRRLAEPILVMPDSTPHHLDTECVNGGAKGPQMEDWLTRDVPDWVRGHLRVAADAQSWATMGLSTGGFCATMATFLHPDTYGAAIELGGYLAPVFDPAYQPFARGSAAWDRYDLVKRAAADPPDVQLWVETSKADTLSYPGNARLIAAATPPLRVTADVLPGAGHRMTVWVAAMPTAFTWLGRSLTGFHPAA
ncbi:esterase family protein [Cellulomonas sp. P24]|uniref:alpha/beta hydrolase n=1 Tax=Cellulomonas sp. P24 TaxID=2885206 RepID=UPI00216B2033|nr:esterase family protein [Cellulomonas sp. P24]MCR6493216.1 esterase family protein [Cellulomonas sp. P24]